MPKSRVFINLTGKKPQPGPNPTTWPEGVIARYLTIAGATVDLKTDRSGDCTGCDFHINWGELKYARHKAQDHAEQCRAMPRPTA